MARVSPDIAIVAVVFGGKLAGGEPIWISFRSRTDKREWLAGFVTDGCSDQRHATWFRSDFLSTIEPVLSLRDPSILDSASHR